MMLNDLNHQINHTLLNHSILELLIIVLNALKLTNFLIKFIILNENVPTSGISVLLNRIFQCHRRYQDHKAELYDYRLFEIYTTTKYSTGSNFPFH